MKKLVLVVAAILAASMGGSVMAADTKSAEIKEARKVYDTEMAKAKSDYSKANAECKKLAKESQSACIKEARKARTTARNAAGEAYTKATGKPDPSPGH